MSFLFTNTTDLKRWEYDIQSDREPFAFEYLDSFQPRVWTAHYRNHVAALCLFYCFLVHLGPRIMKDRKAFNLKKALAIWNFSFAVFSIVSFLRVFPGFYDIWKQENGPYEMVCVRSKLEPTVIFWGLLFTISKILEFGDTVFLVLRKKQVSFLHWFHHMSMAFLTFLLYSEMEPMGRLVLVWNLGVHSVMYTYFGLRALDVKLPRRLAMSITLLQLTQFSHGMSYQIYTLWALAHAYPCERTSLSLKLYFIFGTAYLTLFAKLFYESYISKPSPKKLLKYPEKKL